MWLTLEENARLDGMDVDKATRVLGAYLDHLARDAPPLPQPGHTACARRGLAGAVVWLMRQSPRTPAVLASIVALFRAILPWSINLLQLPPVADDVLLPALSVLVALFDQQRVIYRIASSQPALDSWVTSQIRPNADLAAGDRRWVDPARIASRVAWDHPNSHLFGSLVTEFGNLGGFDALVARLRGPPVSLDCLKATVKVFQRLRTVAGDTLLNDFFPLLPRLVFERQLLDLDTNDLRRVTKKDIEDIDRAMRLALRLNPPLPGLEAPDDICDKFCFAFALVCLRSPLQDKKFNGLAHIEESIENIARERKTIFRPPVALSQVPEIERKVSNLLSWLRENHILELVFQRDNMRRELIVLTKKTVRFMQQEGELELGHVSILLEGILDHHHDKNRDVRDALYDTLIESADRISNVGMARLIWNTVRRMDPAKHFCGRTVKLLSAVIEGARDPAFALEVSALVWDMVQDSSRAPMDAVHAALEALPRIADSLDFDLVPDCVAALRRKKSGLQSLKLLWELVSRAPNKRKKGELAEALLVDQGVFALAVEELAHYKRACQVRRREYQATGDERDWDNEVLVGLFPHLEAVETRLLLLSKLTDEAGRLPDAEYLRDLWKTAVHTFVTQKECDKGLDWIVNMCISDEKLAAGLFEQVVLTSGMQQKIFTRSDAAFNIFLSLLYAVNADALKLRVKSRHHDVLSFEESLDWPFVGVRELVGSLAHDAGPELWTRGQDIVINMHLVVAPSALVSPDVFREGLAELVFDMLEQGTSSQSQARVQSWAWVDRLVALLRTMVVLTKGKEEEAEGSSNGGSQSKNGASTGALADNAADEAAEAAKPALFSIYSMDRDKVTSFVEMMGEGFPEDYRYAMAAVLLKDAVWNLERAINDYLMDGEVKTAYALEEAKKFKRYVPDHGGGAAAEAAAGMPAAKPEPSSKATPMAEVIGRQTKRYDVLFSLLECSSAVDREAIWTLLKMLPPDARLTSLLSDEMAGEGVEWNRVLGDKASYHLLYSLELVRQNVPSEEDSLEARLIKSEWCRAFVLRGGFAYLFELLSGIAVLKERGHIERACLGHLLRIVFYFLRAELDGTLGKSQEFQLSLSQSSAGRMQEGAPFDQLGALMFHLLMERTTKLEHGAESKAGTTDATEEADVARFAVYLLVGSLRKQPRLLDHLVENEADFGGGLRALLCSPDSALRNHVAEQLIWLAAQEKQRQEGSSHRDVAQYLLQETLEWIPLLMVDEVRSTRCSSVFSLLAGLLGHRPLVLPKGLSWCDDPEKGLLPAIAGLIEKRAPGREKGAFGPEDQVMAGLFQLAGLLLEEGEDKSMGTLVADSRFMELVLGECLFGTSPANGGCSAASTRRAGLELCAKLARHSPAGWEFAVRLLGTNYLEQQPFSSWRPVEGAGEVKRTRYVGLRNLGATCYMNATLQQLYMMPELRNAVLAAPVTEEQRTAEPASPDGMLWQFQRLVASLLHSDSSWADTEPFVKTLRDGMGDPINQSRQEDAYDFLTRFQEQLEGQMKKTSASEAGEKVFRKMFSVEMSQEIECLNGHAKATAQEAEPVLQVDFAPTIEAALDSTFGLGGDPISDYRCDGCGGKVDIVKRHMIHRSSDQLVVMLRRFEWDYFAVGGNTRKKLQGNFEIPHRLNLSPFTEAGIRERRLGRQPVLEPQWEYELRGIVVHSGRTMDSGHYYSIIRDLDTNEWFKFDDRDVTPFPLEYLHEKHPKFIGECYMLLFQKVSEDLTRSQHLLNSQSIDTVDSHLLAEVERQNSGLVAQRRFQELPYFSFLLDLLSQWRSGGNVQVAPETMLLAAQTASLCVWEPWVRARQAVGEQRQEVLKRWVDEVLEPLFALHVPAAEWAAKELLGRRSRWLRFFLLECEEPWVRAGFAKWLGAVIRCLCQAEMASHEGKLMLGGQLLDGLMSLFELSRSHWRRFNEYWLVLRDAAAQAPGARYHLASSMYPSYLPDKRLLSTFTLYVDYFMGEFSPFVKELPYAQQPDRATLGNKMGGEGADLVSHFWAMWEVVQALDTGAPGRPGGPFVSLSKDDVSIWRRSDMMVSLIKQGYNPQANALMVTYFQWEHKGWTLWFSKLLLDCFFKEMSAPVFEVVMASLLLRDSLHPHRVQLMLGTAHSGILATLRERRNHHPAVVLNQLTRLAELFDHDPETVSYMVHIQSVWFDWVEDFLHFRPEFQELLVKFTSLSERPNVMQGEWKHMLETLQEDTEAETVQEDDLNRDDDDNDVFDDDDDDDDLLTGGNGHNIGGGKGKKRADMDVD